MRMNHTINHVARRYSDGCAFRHDFISQSTRLSAVSCSFHFADALPFICFSALSPSVWPFPCVQWCDKFESKYPIVGKIVDYSQANSGPKPADGVYTQSSL